MAKSNRNSQVDTWLKALRNPQRPLIEAVRDVVLGADDRISETIKWRAPTFTYKGELASFVPYPTSYACLLFHEGETIPGNFPSLLTENTQARTLRIRDVADLETKREEIKTIVRAWCDMQDQAAA
jgi:hypothetical protein